MKQESIDKMFRLLFAIISKNRGEKEFLEMMDDVFTPTEKVMIAKRVLGMYLLVKGAPQLVIAKALKVSTATVSRYAIMLERKEGELTKVIQALLKKENIENILEDLISDIFSQPGIKIGGWASYWEHKKSQNKRITSGI